MCVIEDSGLGWRSVGLPEPARVMWGVGTDDVGGTSPSVRRVSIAH